MVREVVKAFIQVFANHTNISPTVYPLGDNCWNPTKPKTLQISLTKK